MQTDTTRAATCLLQVVCIRRFFELHRRGVDLHAVARVVLAHSLVATARRPLPIARVPDVVMVPATQELRAGRAADGGVHVKVS